ncbi:hypothetical protein ACFOSD_01555 [Salinispirillum marinum]|uniref:Uncharacterized protein n=2 Tax=Saccharospirillaceae TaxID=255527 RepID=A0ABV8B9N0_9GAMM
MDIRTWTIKERCVAAFWLVCAVVLATEISRKAAVTEISTSLQSLGLLAFFVSWALSPKFFLQPLSESMKGPIQKPLMFGWVTFATFQVASLVARYLV